MQKIVLNDRLSIDHTWEKNDDEADLFIEGLRSSNKYGLPNEITITKTDLTTLEPPVYTCAENIDIFDPVYYCGTLYTQEVKHVKTTFDGLSNPFAGKNFEMCTFGERQIAVLFPHATFGSMQYMSGACGEEVEWGEPNESVDIPSSYYISSYGESQVIIVMTKGEDSAGWACIADPSMGEWTFGPWSQFSTGALCSDMTCMEIYAGAGLMTVAYKDGTDGLGYTRIGHVDEGTPTITWDAPYNHGITECYENRLCSFGWGEEGEKLFGVFYRRAVGAYKGYVRTFGYATEGGGFTVKSGEVVCVPSFSKNMRPVCVTEGEEGIKVALAYLDNDSGGNGMVCIGTLTDMANPIFNPIHSTVVNPGLTSSLSISANPNTMNGTFYMMWIDNSKGRRCEFGHYYYENDFPKSNVGEHVVDYWPSVCAGIIGFQYMGFMDVFMLFSVDEGYDTFNTYSYVTGETGLQYFRAIGGFARSAGEIGETIEVALFGDVVDHPDTGHNQVSYLDRNGKITGAVSPFPISIGLNMNQIQYTKLGALE